MNYATIRVTVIYSSEDCPAYIASSIECKKSCKQKIYRDDIRLSNSYEMYVPYRNERDLYQTEFVKYNNGEWFEMWQEKVEG